MRRRIGRQCGPVRVAPDDRGDDVGDRLAGERRPAGEQFEQHAAEGPDIGPLVDAETARLLGAHIRRRAHERSVARRQARRLVRAAGLGPTLCQPEIEDFDDAIGGELDVGRFQVAVDDTFFVSGIETVRDLACDRQRFRDRKAVARPAHRSRQTVRERFTFDELEDESAHARTWRTGGLLDPVDRADVRMVERGEHARLAVEPRHALGIRREDRRKDLDRHIPPQPAVAGAIHLSHASRAEQLPDLVGPYRTSQSRPRSIRHGGIHRRSRQSRRNGVPRQAAPHSRRAATPRQQKQEAFPNIPSDRDLVVVPFSSASFGLIGKGNRAR